MRTIAVILGDNDFGNTFRPLLESLYRAIQFHNRLTESDVRACWEAAIEFHYTIFQCAGRPAQETRQDKLGYLAGATILFDAEAEADILTKDRNHGAWYLEVASGVIRSY